MAFIAPPEPPSSDVSSLPAGRFRALVTRMLRRWRRQVEAGVAAPAGTARDLFSRPGNRLSAFVERLRERWRRPASAGRPELNWPALSIVALIALVLQTWMLALTLFEPPLPYRVARMDALPESERFVRTLAPLTGAQVYGDTRFEVLTNGPAFYEAELAAIRSARRSINLEAYIFRNDEIGQRFLHALTERARAGVRVNVLLDAVGSLWTRERSFEALKEAGGRFDWYHPLRWNTWTRMNSRSHREILVVDGSVGFVGGAGVADHWYKTTSQPRWRDTMVRLEGAAVTGLQATFAENWLEAQGEVLTGPDYFPFSRAQGTSLSMVVSSSPTYGRSAEVHILVQCMLAAARRSIHLTTPYFVPDDSLRKELAGAVRERGVEVRILVPGLSIDHLLSRHASRRLMGNLLEAGVKIYEYRPSMIHTKALVIDGLWGVVGSANMNARSFGRDDEVNLAVRDAAFAARLEQDFQRDLSSSDEITYDAWKNRTAFERIHEWFGILLERNQ
ncbi:MAG: cardiolipin synthase B [Acidobacteria bacterium]|nr:cardiolipin synthase B [Acidobacteriota bacterium]